MNKEKRARQIAKDTKLPIIEMEMEDWKTSADNLRVKIKKLEEEWINADNKWELWKRARKIKKEMIKDD